MSGNLAVLAPPRQRRLIQTDRTNPTTTPDPRVVIARYTALFLEGLWLIAAIAIPLAAVSPGVVLSHMEVPKVAVFRGLVATMAIVWLVEWLILQPRLSPRITRFSLRGLVSWLSERPTRWVLLSLWLFLAVNALSTLTSLSPEVSFWGKRPGGDGYGLYNVLSYAVLFAVVVTHLKQRVQLWRLVAAIVAVGSLVGVISILQHFGLDPIWTRGNPQARALATLGNPIFAGAFLLMTSVITMAAVVALLTRRDALVRVAAPATGILLAIQLIGIAYTFSRGPWIGLAVAIAVFLGLSWTTIRSPQLRNTTTMAAVVPLIVVVIVFFVVSSLASDSPVSDPDSQTVVQRALSIYPEIAAGGISARTRIWDASLDLVLQRPWHDVTEDPAPWARLLLGYGPETFRYAYPLGSPNGATASFPLEAHNVPLHAAVELGILGLLTLIAVFMTVTVAGARRLLGANNSASLAERVLLAGSLAVLVGRTVEMMGGIPKVGDLAVLMLLLALLVSPNPPKDTDGRREDSGRGWVRELQGRWPGVLG